MADPTKEVPLLHYLCTAIRRPNGDNKRSRLPITLQLLHVIQRKLFCKQSLAPLDKALFWAAFTLAFYGSLQASEYTSPSPTHYLRQLHLLTQDVTICKEGMEVHIKGSKTDQFKNSTTLHIARLGMPTCPVRAMEKFLGQSSHKNSLPLFTFRNGRFLTRIDVSSMTN